jgi:hypothetical protein
VITSFYISTRYSTEENKIRNEELRNSLLKNIESSFIEKIHLFIDDIPSLNKLIEITKHTDKITIIDIGKKPLYSDFLNYAIDNLKNKICMITNSDIYLHSCDKSLISKLRNNKWSYALTRYEWDMTPEFINDYGGSHDCYIFNSAFLDKSIINRHTNIIQNKIGIESHIIKSFCDSGFKVFNPCYQIQIVHLHKSELRSNGDWIGLHKFGDHDGFRKSCWCVPPKYLLI